MCLIHLHFLFFISFFYWLFFGSVPWRDVVLDTLSDHFRCKILRRHLLMKVCILYNSPCLLVSVCMYLHFPKLNHT